jgi:DNA polymerase-3 subunit alpha
MTDSFTHLHLHTEFSMLDGAARVKDVVQKAAEDGQPAVGITDHGNMYGVLDFYKACQEVGIKPIIGTEAYMAKDHRSERPKRGGKKVDDSGGETEEGQKLYYHATLLAENNTGYQNLIQIASRAFMEGYYYKPRADWEVFQDHHEGVIATSGCLGGQVLQALLHGNYDEALRRAGRFQDIFGKDNFFIEIQDHGIPEQHQTNPDLFRIAKALDAPLLLTNDSHYTDEEDHLAHDALLCVQTRSKISDKDRFKFHGHEHYLKTAAEMRSLFPDHRLW